MNKRMIITFALSVLFISSFALMRSSGNKPDMYYHAKKYNWYHNCNLVIGGDSRVENGLDPENMEPILGCRIKNYAYSGLKFSPEYFERLEKCIAPETEKKIIAIGVQPSFFLPSQYEHAFLHLSGMSDEKRYIYEHFLYKYSGAFEPIVIKGRNLYRTMHASGFYEILNDDINPEQKQQQINGYSKDEKADKTLIDAFYGFVDKWNKSGIIVIGFQMPTDRDMLRLQSSKWNKTDFIENFEKVGGIWIDMPNDKYKTFDGSHLTVVEAKRFSKTLAIKIKKIKED